VEVGVLAEDAAGPAQVQAAADEVGVDQQLRYARDLLQRAQERGLRELVDQLCVRRGDPGDVVAGELLHLVGVAEWAPVGPVGPVEVREVLVRELGADAQHVVEHDVREGLVRRVARGPFFGVHPGLLEVEHGFGGVRTAGRDGRLDRCGGHLPLNSITFKLSQLRGPTGCPILPPAG
jgi:hypothetical protein